MNLGNNNRGVPFNSRIIREGDKYGLGFCLTHEGEPVVEFYDARYGFTPYGQFVSRYRVSTLHDFDGHGLDLHGGIPDWEVTNTQIKQALSEA